MGITGILLGEPPYLSWREIAEWLLARPREGKVSRATKETRITTEINLDGSGHAEVSTGIGYFDHMLEQLAKHGGLDLRLKAEGDLNVDEHHTVEDVALAIGQALRQAVGDKVGIGRYGFVLPMDESETQVSLDFSGRPYLVFDGKFDRECVGQLPTELVSHFYRSLAEAAGLTLHVKVRGENTHHMVESTFKAVGRALRAAVANTGRGELPSTKGVL
jgi:imidazoleglycerol-phosphate dehydratase/histidinol-phosphatase